MKDQQFFQDPTGFGSWYSIILKILIAFAEKMAKMKNFERNIAEYIHADNQKTSDDKYIDLAIYFEQNAHRLAIPVHISP